MKKKKKYYVMGLLSIIFIIITILMLTSKLVGIDDFIYNFIMSFRCNFLDIFSKIITGFGNTIPVLCIVVILFLNFRKRNQKELGIIVLSTVIINLIIKNLIRRDRPMHLRLIKENGFSYPSGHAMISVALYGYLIYYVFKNVNNKKLKIIYIVLLSGLILLIGLSRVYLGVHYPSDILAGYILSLIILIFILTNIKKIGGILSGKNGSK